MRLQNGSPGLAIGAADDRYFRLTAANSATKYQIFQCDGLDGYAWPSVNVGHTWNAAGDTWTAFNVNVTDMASASGSKLANFSVAGVSKFSVTKAGVINGASLGFNACDTLGGVGFIAHGIADIDGDYWRIYKAGFYGVAGCFQLGSGVGFNWRSTATAGAGSADTGLHRNAAGVLEFNSGTPGTLRDWKARRANLTEYLDINEMTAPSAPAANTARLYVEDNGSGKTRLMVLFPSGAAQQVAIEP